MDMCTCAAQAQRSHEVPRSPFLRRAAKARVPAQKRRAHVAGKQVSIQPRFVLSGRLRQRCTAGPAAPGPHRVERHARGGARAEHVAAPCVPVLRLAPQPRLWEPALPAAAPAAAAAAVVAIAVAVAAALAVFTAAGGGREGVAVGGGRARVRIGLGRAVRAAVARAGAGLPAAGAPVPSRALLTGVATRTCAVPASLRCVLAAGAAVCGVAVVVVADVGAAGIQPFIAACSRKSASFAGGLDAARQRAPRGPGSRSPVYTPRLQRRSRSAVQIFRYGAVPASRLGMHQLAEHLHTPGAACEEATAARTLHTHCQRWGAPSMSPFSEAAPAPAPPPRPRPLGGVL